jgi:hypothetical protein
MESGAVVARAVGSWIRFGTFELFWYRGEKGVLKQLADYVIDYYFPGVKTQVLAVPAPEKGERPKEKLLVPARMSSVQGANTANGNGNPSQGLGGGGDTAGTPPTVPTTTTTTTTTTTKSNAGTAGGLATSLATEGTTLGRSSAWKGSNASLLSTAPFQPALGRKLSVATRPNLQVKEERTQTGEVKSVVVEPYASGTMVDIELNIYARFFREVIRRTSITVAHWQAVGFCHGVLNSVGNFSYTVYLKSFEFRIRSFSFMFWSRLYLTLCLCLCRITCRFWVLPLIMDRLCSWTSTTHGPTAIYQVLFAARFFLVLSGSTLKWLLIDVDEVGRYRFEHQPKIALWNLSKLGRALVELVALDEDGNPQRSSESGPLVDGSDIIRQLLDLFEPMFVEKYTELMRKVSPNGETPTTHILFELFFFSD